MDPYATGTKRHGPSMKKGRTTISVIIPTYNEERLLPRCLKSVTSQHYPRKDIEIIVVDDGSTDRTKEIAKKFGAKIIHNGTHHIERGKSIGLKNARGTYIFFIDADNALTTPYWFRDAIGIFQKHQEVTGIESFRYRYKKDDSLVNRYCALFGINDPLTFYLGKGGFLPATAAVWQDTTTRVADFKGYFLARFTPENMAVIGSNGYMTKRALLMTTDWDPYLFHLDSAYDLVKAGHGTFARIKYDIEHDFAGSVSQMLTKIKRNAELFLQYQDIRRYKYHTSVWMKARTVLIMGTIIVPTIDALKGYRAIHDPAWFLHPVLCVLVLFVDMAVFLRFYMAQVFKRL